MSSGEYKLYLNHHSADHDTWPAPPPPPSESLPTVPPLEDYDLPGFGQGQDPDRR